MQKDKGYNDLAQKTISLSAIKSQCTAALKKIETTGRDSTKPLTERSRLARLHAFVESSTTVLDMSESTGLQLLALLNACALIVSKGAEQKLGSKMLMYLVVSDSESAFPQRQALIPFEVANHEKCRKTPRVAFGWPAPPVLEAELEKPTRDNLRLARYSSQSCFVLARPLSN